MDKQREAINSHVQAYREASITRADLILILSMRYGLDMDKIKNLIERIK